MTKPIIKLLILGILIGCIGIGLNTVFGTNTVSFISQHNINGVSFYKYDFWGYIENIRGTIQNTAQLELHFPARTWQANISNLTEFWDALINNLAVMLDWFIFANNILLYPLRIIFYIIQILLSLFGIPTLPGSYDNNPLKWLIVAAQFMTTAEIPYI